MSEYVSLEALIRDFVRKFHREGRTDLNDKTVASYFSLSLARRIREYAIVRKRVDEKEK